MMNELVMFIRFFLNWLSRASAVLENGPRQRSIVYFQLSAKQPVSHFY